VKKAARIFKKVLKHKRSFTQRLVDRAMKRRNHARSFARRIASAVNGTKFKKWLHPDLVKRERAIKGLPDGAVKRALRVTLTRDEKKRASDMMSRARKKLILALPHYNKGLIARALDAQRMPAGRAKQKAMKEVSQKAQGSWKGPPPRKGLSKEALELVKKAAVSFQSALGKKAAAEKKASLQQKAKEEEITKEKAAYKIERQALRKGGRKGVAKLGWVI